MPRNELPPFQTLTHDKLYGKAGPNGNGRQPLTKALFHQFRHETNDEYETIFTLNEYDHDGCYSIYKLYIAHVDEYAAAMAIFGSWKYWKQLCQAPWFKECVDRWNEEMEVRDRSNAKATIILAASDGNVPAAKALDDLHRRRTAGRPSKEEVKRQTRIAQRVDETVADLTKRLPK